MASLFKLSVMEMRQGLLRGDFSAVELAEAHLSRIEATNSFYNSFITVTEKAARAAAKAADQVLAANKEQSPLLSGIPIAVKDMLVTKDIETTCGSKILKGFVPPYDGTAVARLKSQGAVIVGKTNMDEFAMGSSTENSSFGPAKNAWDPSRVPGGSSGGSAVAVCIGQAPLALGTDTGGSIRQPASLSGILGLKPTYGRVSRYGAVAFASSLDQIGPFARTIEDLAAILGIIAGKDTHDSTSMEVPVPNYLEEVRAAKGKGLQGVRIGVPKEYFIPGTEEDVEREVKNAIDVLVSLGAELVQISLPHTEYALATYYIIAPSEAASNLARYDGVRYGHRSRAATTLQEMYERSRAEGFGEEVKRRIMIGNHVLSTGYYDAYYRKAQQVRTLLVNDFKAAFHNHCDLIVMPTSPTTAFKIGERIDSPLTMYLADVFTVPVNLAGLPGLSVPCGLDRNRLPIGFQLVGAPFSESRLLVAGQAFLEAKPFDTKAMTEVSPPN